MALCRQASLCCKAPCLGGTHAAAPSSQAPTACARRAIPAARMWMTACTPQHSHHQGRCLFLQKNLLSQFSYVSPEPVLAMVFTRLMAQKDGGFRTWARRLCAVAAHTACPQQHHQAVLIPRHLVQRPTRKTVNVLSFSYVCPEPVLVK